MREFRKVKKRREKKIEKKKKDRKEKTLERQLMRNNQVVEALSPLLSFKATTLQSQELETKTLLS